MKIMYTALIHRDEQPDHKAVPPQHSPAFASLLDARDPGHQSHAHAFSERGLVQTGSETDFEQRAPSRKIGARIQIDEQANLKAPSNVIPQVAMRQAFYPPTAGAHAYFAQGTSAQPRKNIAERIVAAPGLLLLAPTTARDELPTDESVPSISPDLPTPLEVHFASPVSVKLTDGTLHVTFLPGSLTPVEAAKFQRTAAEIIRDEGFGKASLRFLGELGPPLFSKGSRHG
jgi:hypothetical protein